MKQKKLCVDCKHCKIKDDDIEFAKCTYTKKTIFNAVDGGTTQIKQPWDYCSILRDQEDLLGIIWCYTLGTCGPQGRFFERKEK